MTTLRACLRERWRRLRTHPDLALAALLLVLLFVLWGRPWPAPPHGAPASPGGQQVLLDEDYVFDD